ncbi:MAG: ion channel [Flavobacteriales bacterium]
MKVFSRNRNDLGFGEKSYNKGSRLINSDGTFNVKRKGLSTFNVSDVYHLLITIKWWQFAIFISTLFFVANTAFAFIYLAVGVGQITSITEGTAWDNFWDAFYFSTQTMTTVGYGFFAPVGTHAKIIASIESFVGLLGFAIATGVLYGRFSRPVARIRYSEKAIIAPYQEANGMMFRMVNMRNNQLIEIEVSVNMVWLNKETNKREYARLPLEIEKINFMPLSWTIVHPIDEASPFWGKDPSYFADQDGEIIILVKAFDESFSQVVYDRRSYKVSEFAWGARFVSAIENRPGGIVYLDIDGIDKFEEVSLNSPLNFVAYASKN